MGTPQTDVDMWSSSPGAIPGPVFKTTRRGYDQTEVTDYIRGLTERLETVEKQARKLQSDVARALQDRDAAFGERDEALRGRAGDAYERTSARVAELLMGVDREVERIQAEARVEVERMLADAEKDASRIRADAEEQRRAADQAGRRTREEAERSVADLTSQRERILEELRLASARMLDVIAGMETPARDLGTGPTAGDDADASKGESASVVIPDLRTEPST